MPAKPFPIDSSGALMGALVFRSDGTSVPAGEYLVETLASGHTKLSYRSEPWHAWSAPIWRTTLPEGSR